MPRNKDRLYVALHLRGGSVKMPGGEDKYHWSLLLGPKTEHPSSTCTMLHAKETITVTTHGIAASTWVFEERDLCLAGANTAAAAAAAAAAARVLARVCVAKVRHREALRSVLRGVPLRGGGGAGQEEQRREGWNCVGWVQEALETLHCRAVLGTNRVGDWQAVRDEALGYIERKKREHRYDGKAEEGQYDMQAVPTWDMLRGRELVS